MQHNISECNLQSCYFIWKFHSSQFAWKPTMNFKTPRKQSINQLNGFMFHGLSKIHHILCCNTIIIGSRKTVRKWDGTHWGSWLACWKSIGIISENLVELYLLRNVRDSYKLSNCTKVFESFLAMQEKTYIPFFLISLTLFILRRWPIFYWNIFHCLKKLAIIN